jgi:hypothetical protein
MAVAVLVLDHGSGLETLAQSEACCDTVLATHLGVKRVDAANKGGSVGVTCCHADILNHAVGWRNTFSSRKC